MSESANKLLEFQSHLHKKRNRNVTCPICGNQHAFHIPHVQKNKDTLKVTCGHCGFVLQFDLEQMNLFIEHNFLLQGGESDEA